MVHQHKSSSDLPDYLQDSVLYNFAPADEYHVRPRPPRTCSSVLRNVLRSRRLRGLLVFGAVAYLLLQARVLVATTLARHTGPSCLHQDPLELPPLSPDDGRGELLAQDVDVDWTHFAYVQYATDVEYLCNAVMMFASLHRAASRPARLLLYPATYEVNGTEVQSHLLRRARDEYGVVLQPVAIMKQDTGFERWAASYTKLLAFNQTQYDRVLHLDSDGLILKPNLLDSLFLLPPAPIVLPRAYWLAQQVLASHIMLLTPSSETFRQLQTFVLRYGRHGTYDMEIVNSFFGRTCALLPHRQFALLSGEFRRPIERHLNWLSPLGDGVGGDIMHWDPRRAAREAAWVHFSDDPLPKPWVDSDMAKRTYLHMRPVCYRESGGQARGRLNCVDRELWTGFYEEFWRLRSDVCNVAPVVSNNRI